MSCLDSQSDGTHSLQMILWWASDVMLNLSRSVPNKDTKLPRMTWGYVHFQNCFYFGMNYSFNPLKVWSKIHIGKQWHLLWKVEQTWVHCDNFFPSCLSFNIFNRVDSYWDDSTSLMKFHHTNANVMAPLKCYRKAICLIWRKIFKIEMSLIV